VTTRGEEAALTLLLAHSWTSESLEFAAEIARDTDIPVGGLNSVDYLYV